MNKNSNRLWYFEAHFADGSKCYVGRNGTIVERDQVLEGAFAGVEREAHGEAERRCVAYEALYAPSPIAMSFSTASTLFGDSNT